MTADPRQSLRPETAARQKARLEAMVARLVRLRGTGPNPFDYWIWADETRAVLDQVYGRDSQEANAFSEIVGTRGRTPEQRGQADNMTLNLHGEWGIWARLDRAEALLRRTIDGM
jgi:hypothetical protein